MTEHVLQPARHGAVLDLDQPLGGTGFTVSAWIDVSAERAEAMQVIAARWPLRPRPDALDEYDAGATDGLRTRGFFGAVFDGRHVYFAPQHDGQDRHGAVLRYDTHAAFDDPAGWAGYDAAHTSGLRTRGYYGAVFDGRRVTFVPRNDGRGMHSRILQHDTHGDFRDPASWQARDAGLPISYQGAAFDGRHIYFVPGIPEGGGGSGQVLRLDTHADLGDDGALRVYGAAGTGGLDSRCYDGAVFDGRHIYFAPLTEAAVALRYDVAGAFDDPASWQAIDAGPFGLHTCVGAVFDGRYVHYVPYAHARVARFDTEGAFDDPAGWQAHDAAGTDGVDTVGYDGAVFDGRYVWHIPFWRGDAPGVGFHCRVLRCDTLGAFDDPASWQAVDGAPAIGGYNGGAFDGRFAYFAPWRHDAEPDVFGAHGRVLRCDTVQPEASFVLKAMDCGHNGGLGAAVPGPSVTVNTPAGPVSAQAHRLPGAGRHHLAATYDGQQLRLYVDGALAARQDGRGPMVPVSGRVTLGALEAGAAAFGGRIDEVRLADTAQAAAAIAAWAGRP